jgi:2-aminoadipate transaminase
MALITKGDKIAVEAPTYVGALQAFTPYEPEYIRMATDDDGLVPDALEAVLRTESVKFIYLIPTFQNPSGRTIPYSRRREIAAIVRKYDRILIEDDPYSALRYRGNWIPPIKTLAPEHVVYIGTFSKIFAPGLRIGFCVAPERLRKWLVIMKQGIDLHSSTFNQALAAEYLSGGFLKKHLPHILDLYRPRQEAMLSALEGCFPEEFQWSRPEGGMFIWCRGPEGLDMEDVYWKAVKRKTAFVPGKFFYAHKGDGLETMRLNFTMNNEDTIRRAVHIISGVLKTEMARKPIDTQIRSCYKRKA